MCVWLFILCECAFFKSINCRCVMDVGDDDERTRAFAFGCAPRVPYTDGVIESQHIPLLLLLLLVLPFRLLLLLHSIAVIVHTVPIHSLVPLRSVYYNYYYYCAVLCMI